MWSQSIYGSDSFLLPWRYCGQENGEKSLNFPERNVHEVVAGVSFASGPGDMQGHCILCWSICHFQKKTDKPQNYPGIPVEVLQIMSRAESLPIQRSLSLLHVLLGEPVIIFLPGDPVSA